MQIKTFTFRQIEADPSIVEGLTFLSQDSEAREAYYTVPETKTLVASGNAGNSGQVTVTGVVAGPPKAHTTTFGINMKGVEQAIVGKPKPKPKAKK